MFKFYIGYKKYAWGVDFNRSFYKGNFYEGQSYF